MLYFSLQVIIVAATAAACYIFIAALARKYLGYNPTAPSAWERFKAWWSGFVKRHIVDDDPYDKPERFEAWAHKYDKPTPEQIECARRAVKASVGECDCQNHVCALGHNCPVDAYCPCDKDARYHVALAWLHAHGIEP